jgi:hypothetical protein
MTHTLKLGMELGLLTGPEALKYAGLGLVRKGHVVPKVREHTSSRERPSNAEWTRRRIPAHASQLDVLLG